MNKKPARKNKLAFFGKISLFLIFILASTLIPSKNHSAEAFWGEFVQVIFHKSLDRIYASTQGIIMGAAKREAAISINSQLESLVSGGGGSSARFITNWEDYLVDQPTRKTNRYINDYLGTVTGGRGSAGYRRSSGRNYSQTLLNIGKQSTSERRTPTVDYTGDPDNMFAEGNFSGMNSYLDSDGINNPWGFEMNARNEYKRRKQREERIAESKSVAYGGFIGVGEEDGTGNISNPGSVIHGDMVNARDIGNKSIANASELGEVITGMVSQMISRSMQTGIGTVRRSINREVKSVNRGLSREINQSIREIGPSAAYRR